LLFFFGTFDQNTATKGNGAGLKSIARFLGRRQGSVTNFSYFITLKGFSKQGKELAKN